MSAAPKSWLFTPGSRPDRFAKALASGADAVILDLEDAVAEPDKAAARTNVLEALAAWPAAGCAAAVRINSLDRAVGLTDLATLGQASRRPDFVIVPKAEHAQIVRMAGAVLTEGGAGAGVIALIETARGVAGAAEIATAPGLSGLMFGAADYSADLGVIAGAHRHDYARAAVANAAAAAGVAAIDSPAFAIDDLPTLETECEWGRGLGFSAKAAIHPRHLDIVNRVFAWTDQDRDRAARILEADDGAGVMDGRMIDQAMRRWAMRVRAG
jgi:(S)-citramalyl-CoA lyase